MLGSEPARSVRHVAGQVVIGLFTGGLWRNLNQVNDAMLEWVAYFNIRWLLEPPG
jgi:hypothetical protein